MKTREKLRILPIEIDLVEGEGLCKEYGNISFFPKDWNSGMDNISYKIL